MNVNRTSPLSFSFGNQSQELRTDRQSLPTMSARKVSTIPEDSSAFMWNFNRQFSSPDKDDFELLSCEDFEESTRIVRMQSLFEIWKFDIEDAASHVHRVNRCADEPMLMSELRARLKDLQRLHTEICSAFQDLMKMKSKDSLMIRQLFETHFSSYMSGKETFECLIKEMQEIKPHVRIDFQRLRSENMKPKFTRNCSSGDIIASLPGNMERPATHPIAAVPELISQAKSLLFEVSKTSVSGLNGSSLVHSHPPQVSSSPELIHHLKDQEFVQRPLCYTTSSSSPAASLPTSVERTAPSRLVHTTMKSSKPPMPSSSAAPPLVVLSSEITNPAQVLKVSSTPLVFSGSSRMPANSPSSLSSEKSSTDPSSTEVRFQTSFTDHRAIAILKVSNPDDSTQFVQRPASASSSRLHLHMPLLIQPTTIVSKIYERFQESASEHSANASPHLARFRVLLSQAVQRPANASPTATRFHVYTPSPFGPGNASFKMIRFDLDRPTTLNGCRSLSSRQGSANASPSEARFPTKSSKHSANASPQLARFRLFSLQFVQRPASASLARLHLCMPQFRTQLTSRPVNVSFESSQFYQHLCQHPSNIFSTSFNANKLQIINVQDEDVIFSISSFVLGVNDRPWKLTPDNREMKSAKMSHIESGEFFVNFLADDEVRNLEVHHDKDDRWCQMKKRMKNINFNAAYDKHIATDTTKVVSELLLNFGSVVKLVTSSILAANTLILVACKFLDRCSEATTNFGSSLSVSNFVTFKRFRQGNCLRCEIRQLWKDRQSCFKIWFKALSKILFEHVAIIVANAISKTFCIKRNSVTNIFGCFVVQLHVGTFNNKADLISKVSCISNFRRFIRFEEVIANVHIKGTRNVQASSSVSDFQMSSPRQKTITCLETFVATSAFRLVLKIIDAFNGIAAVISRMKITLTLLLIFESPGKNFVIAKRFITFIQQIFGIATELECARLIKHRRLLIPLPFTFLEKFKPFKSIHLAFVSKFYTTDSTHQEISLLFLKIIVKQEMKKPPRIKHLAIRLAISNPLALPECVPQRKNRIN